MVKFGGWTVDVHDSFPEKVASVIPVLNEKIGFGCDYEAFDYLGYQEVNGKNHAILAQQTVLTGKDVKNAVTIILNEKPGSMDLAVVGVNTVVQAGGELGGTKVEMTNDIPKEAMDEFNKAYEGFVGSKVEPFAYIGEQMAKGTNYIFAAKVRRVVPNAKDYLAIVVVNNLSEKKMTFLPLLDFGSNDNQEDIQKLGYAFTW